MRKVASCDVNSGRACRVAREKVEREVVTLRCLNRRLSIELEQVLIYMKKKTMLGYASVHSTESA